MDMGRPCGKNGSDQAKSINVGRENRQKENWVTDDPAGRHAQVRRRRAMVTNIQEPERMELTHVLFLKLILETPLTEEERGYTCVCNDANVNLPNRSEIKRVLDVPSVNATLLN